MKKEIVYLKQNGKSLFYQIFRNPLSDSPQEVQAEIIHHLYTMNCRDCQIKNPKIISPL